MMIWNVKSSFYNCLCEKLLCPEGWKFASVFLLQLGFILEIDGWIVLCLFWTWSQLNPCVDIIKVGLFPTRMGEEWEIRWCSNRISDWNKRSWHGCRPNLLFGLRISKAGWRLSHTEVLQRHNNVSLLMKTSRSTVEGLENEFCKYFFNQVIYMIVVGLGDGGHGELWAPSTKTRGLPRNWPKGNVWGRSEVILGNTFDVRSVSWDHTHVNISMVQNSSRSFQNHT